MSLYKNRSFRARLGFALQGLVHGVRAERSLQVQLLALAAALAALGMLRPSALWWALVLLSSAVVIAAELFNTALEGLADALHPHDHPGIRIAKDCAAAGVQARGEPRPCAGGSAAGRAAADRAGADRDLSAVPEHAARLERAGEHRMTDCRLTVLRIVDMSRRARASSRG